MKKTLFTLALVAFSIPFQSQNTITSVEKSVLGVQAGVLGIWVHSENKLSKSLALRTEFGLDTGLFGGYYYDQTNFILYPTLSIEPRYYYNLSKRSKKGKKISKNSGNFLTLKLNYVPNWFVISNIDDVSMVENLSIVPKWAIKRTMGKHFTYEVGMGLGYREYFLKQHGHNANSSEVNLDLHLRIGYTFWCYLFIKLSQIKRAC